MSYYVYMLKSIEKKPVTYVGYAKDLKKIESAYIIKEKEQNLQEEENGS